MILLIKNFPFSVDACLQRGILRIRFYSNVKTSYAFTMSGHAWGSQSSPTADDFHLDVMTVLGLALL